MCSKLEVGLRINLARFGAKARFIRRRTPLPHKRIIWGSNTNTTAWRGLGAWSGKNESGGRVKRAPLGDLIAALRNEILAGPGITSLGGSTPE